MSVHSKCLDQEIAMSWVFYLLSPISCVRAGSSVRAGSLVSKYWHFIQVIIGIFLWEPEYQFGDHSRKCPVLEGQDILETSGPYFGHQNIRTLEIGGKFRSVHRNWWPPTTLTLHPFTQRGPSNTFTPESYSSNGLKLVKLLICYSGKQLIRKSIFYVPILYIGTILSWLHFLWDNP